MLIIRGSLKDEISEVLEIFKEKGYKFPSEILEDGEGFYIESVNSKGTCQEVKDINDVNLSNFPSVEISYSLNAQNSGC